MPLEDLMFHSWVLD